MNVVQVNTYDVQGGAARAAWRLHDELRRSGHQSAMLVRFKTSTDNDVHLADCDPGDPKKGQLRRWAKLSEEYIERNRTTVTDCLFSLPVPGYDLALHPLLQQADVIHLHWVAGFLSPLGIARLLQLGKPLVWTLHDQRAFTGGCHFSFGCRKYESTCADCPQLGDKAPNLSSGVLAECLKTLDGSRVTVVTPSRWLATCAKASVLFQQARVIPIANGLDTKLFRPMPKAEARRQLGLDPDGLYFLFGADSIRDRRKGIHILLEALAICGREGVFRDNPKAKSVRFICYGWGSEKHDFGGLPVRGFGRIEQDEKMAGLYAAADAYICPTVEDNLPTTVLESLSCGTPVLASNIGGVPDMVENNRNGLLLPPGDAAALAGAIKWILGNQAVLPEWSANARQGIKAHFTIELQAQRLTALYSELLSARPPSVPAPFAAQTKVPLMPDTWSIPGPLRGRLSPWRRLNLRLLGSK